MMNRTERRLWKNARTFTDLCDLMVQWAEGQIKEWPGHGGGPDPETSGLIPTLAACNRAGYLTTQSQPGLIGAGFDGLLWEQRAVAEGFIADEQLLARVQGAADAAGLMVIVHGEGRSVGPKEGVVVTKRGGKDYTGCGMKLARRHLGCQWPGIHRDAYRAVGEAWQLTIVDPEWGRNDRLWTVLDRCSGWRG